MATAQSPGFGNSSRIRKLPLPHNIRDKFRKPGRVFQNFVESLVKGLIAQIKSSQRSHSSKEDLKAPHNLDGLDLDALVEVSFHKTYIFCSNLDNLFSPGNSVLWIFFISFRYIVYRHLQLTRHRGSDVRMRLGQPAIVVIIKYWLFLFVKKFFWASFRLS